MIKKITSVFFFLFVCTFTYAQEIEVSGVVNDSSEIPIAGINVQVKGKTTGTVTDFDGNYKIKANKGDTLVFTNVAYTLKEVIVTGAKHNVFMTEGNVLDEVVITAFGIKKKEKSLGYALQKVSTKDLNLNGQTNALEAMQGRISGVQMQRTSGSVGGGLDILIRGISSVNPSRSNQPLIVLDGVALNNDTFTGNVLPSAGSNATGSSEQFSFSNRAGDINPDDIESFSVLKGAAATALYGIRASNGAILITTKKGKYGKAKITVTTSTTLRDVVTTPDLQKTFREGHRTTRAPGAVYNPNEPDGYDHPNQGWAFYSWGVPFSDSSYTNGSGDVTDLSNDKFHSPYDLFRTGVNTQLNVSLSGADEKFNYYLSAGRSNDEGIVPNTDYTKTNFRFRGSYNINDKFNVGSSVTYTNSGGSRGNGGDKSIYSSMSYWSSTFDINDYKNADGSQRNYTPGWIDQPRYFAETSNLKDDVNRWIGTLNFNYKIKDWVSLTGNAQVDTYSDLRNRFVPGDLDVGTQVGGFITNETINFTGLESNIFLTFTKEFSEDFNSSLLIGHHVSDFTTQYSYVRGEGLNVPGINSVSNTSTIFGGNSVTQLRDMGVFGDLRLNYKEAIFLSITGRNDWLSTMPQQNRSFFYPSVSSSFIINELLDIKSKTLSFAKVRLSWAKVGKGPNFGQIGHNFSPAGGFPFNGVGGYSQNNFAGDPDLRPEISNSYEIGTDLRFLNNRIKLDYSFYKTKVSDQIFGVGTAYSSGISSYIRNAGDYETWGNEFMLSGDIVKKDKFNWSANLSWSNNKGEITAIPKDLDELVFFDDLITSKAKVGDPVGTLYGWKFQTTPNGERYVGPNGKWVVTGSDNNGLYYTGTNEKVIVGNAMPDYIATLHNQFKYKNISFNFLLEYKKGGDLYDRARRNGIRNGNLLITEFRDQTRVLDGMMDDGSGGYTPNTTPLLINANGYYRDYKSYNTASEILLQDGSWLKLRNVSLSYDFQNMLSKYGIDNMSISASSNNILLWTPFDGYDPEANQFSAGSNIYGFTGLTTPLTQNFSFGLKLKF